LLKSNYNFFVRRADTTIGYNARTGTFAVLTPEAAQALQSEEEWPDSLESASLLDMGFLHLGDEFSRIGERYTNGRRMERELTLTLLPTLACNFSCDYCFQNDHRRNGIMPDHVQKCVLDFLRFLILQGRNRLSITWFGGEPLLATPIVTKMTRDINCLVEECSAAIVRLEIVTNGTRLDEATARILRDCGITRAQVTLDALFYSPPNKRGIINSQGEPSPILANILGAIKYLDISIRLNISRLNQDEIPEIQTVLAKYGLDKRYYLARVHDFQHEFSHQGQVDSRSRSLSLPLVSNTTHSLSRMEFAEFEKNSLLSRPEGLAAMLEQLRPKSHACAATTQSAFVIDPDGFVSRCWHSAGQPEEAIFRVQDLFESYESSDVATRWLNYSPFPYKECSICKVLPLCMGGCSHPRVFLSTNQPACEAIRENVHYCVSEVGRHLDLPTE
jgi:uncharacterized protein